jgi:hypothetical protein
MQNILLKFVISYSQTKVPCIKLSVFFHLHPFSHFRDQGGVNLGDLSKSQNSSQ